MIKKIIITIFTFLFITPVAAQQQLPKKFIPYVIDQQTHKQIFDYLNEQPTKFSLPIMQALAGLAQKAIDEENKKQEEKVKSK